MDTWGGQWQSLLRVMRPCGRPIYPLQDSAAWITELVQQAVRAASDRLKDDKRYDTEFTQRLNLLGWTAAIALLRGRTAKDMRVRGPLERSLLADLTGSSRFMRRLRHADCWHTGDCPWCAHYLEVRVPETKKRVLWQWSYWGSQRKRRKLSLKRVASHGKRTRGGG